MEKWCADALIRTGKGPWDILKIVVFMKYGNPIKSGKFDKA